MLTMMTDVQMTRRKRLVFILDENDTVLYSGAKVAQAIDWLIENGHDKCTVEGESEGLRFDIGFARS